MIILYVFAIIGAVLWSDKDLGKGCFEGVLMSMNCLLKTGIFADQADFIETMSASLMSYVITLAFLFLATVTVMNLLIAILCSVIAFLAEKEIGKEIS